MLAHFVVAAGLAAIGLAVTAAPPAHADTGSAEAQFFADTNSVRAAAGLAPLARDGALDSMARQWSAHMVTACPSLCHNPNLAADAAAIEPNWRGAAENVGVGGSEASIQQAFVNSPGHHANIVGPYNRVGVGVTLAGSSIYVTIDFLEGPAQSEAAGLRQAVRTNAGPAVAAVAPLSGRARFTPTPPQRILDTRTSIGNHHRVLAGGTALALAVAGVGGVPRDAVGVTANVTATGSRGFGYLTVYPCGQSPPTASNVDFTAARSVPNLVTTALGGGKLCIYANVTTDVVVDLAGWYRTASGAAFTALSPWRVLDSRTQAGPSQRFAVALGGVVSSSAVAVAVNVTVTGPTAGGYVSAYPCGRPVPLASNVNFVAGQTVPNSAVVPLGANRSICFFSSTRTQLIIDLSGVFGGSGTALTPVVPARLLDTRNGTGGWLGQLGSSQSINLPVAGRAAVPSNTNGAVLNVTVTQALGPGYLTVYPCGGAVPTTSNLNFVAGETRANLVTIRLGAGGQICFYSYGRTAVIADIAGYLT
jgi:hypothetical protein